jgi:hypothetical protein
MNFFALVGGLAIMLLTLVVLLPVINTFGTDAQTSISNASDSIVFADLPQIMIGLGMGFVFIVGIIIWAYKKATQPDLPPSDFGGY